VSAVSNPLARSEAQRFVANVFTRSPRPGASATWGDSAAQVW
jgi:hypothetical protein